MYIIINSYKFQFFSLLFILIVIYIIHNYIYDNEYNEYFDQKINDTSRIQCGNICTKVSNCMGFSMDDKTNTCYLSKTPILGKPTNSVFSSLYNNDFIRCNKLKQTAETSKSQQDLKTAATFICTPNGHDNNQKIVYYNNDEQILNSTDDLNGVTFSPYTFQKIDWGLEIPYDSNLSTNPSPENSINYMDEQDDEYLGQYLFKNKCSANISKQNCLSQCLNDENCIGTEWNPVYFNKDKNDNILTINKNICCPKIQLKQIIPRRENVEFGKFYIKKNILKHNMDTKDNYVKIGNNEVI